MQSCQWFMKIYYYVCSITFGYKFIYNKVSMKICMILINSNLFPHLICLKLRAQCSATEIINLYVKFSCTINLNTRGTVNTTEPMYDCLKLERISLCYSIWLAIKQTIRKQSILISLRVISLFRSIDIYMDLKLTLAKKNNSGKQLSTIIQIQVHTYTPMHAMPISVQSTLLNAHNNFMRKIMSSTSFQRQLN